MKIFEKGDIVEIIGNIPFDLKNEKSPILGTVMNVDGSYIYVKYWNNVIRKNHLYEFYSGELEHINIKKERKLKLKKLNDVSKNFFGW